MNALKIRLLLCCLLLLASETLLAHHIDNTESLLPMIGPAPDFTLINQHETEFSLTDLRGKVGVVSFMFTRCPDVCPILTAKMLQMQKELGDAFGKDVFFASITIDPQYDSPTVLNAYAELLGYDPTGWTFLTGTPEQIHETVRSYGVFHEQQTSGNINHNLLTSIIDREGTLRVQYMGERFDVQEFLHDLHDLMAEAGSQ